MYEYTDPDITNALFEIRVEELTAYADTVGGAFVAYHQLKKDRQTWGSKGMVINLETGKVAWND